MLRTLENGKEMLENTCKVSQNKQKILKMITKCLKTLGNGEDMLGNDYKVSPNA